jgi:hypothetical protein
MFPGWWRRPADVADSAEDTTADHRCPVGVRWHVEDGHVWDRTCTTVVAGKPLIVEYVCRRCGLWTVEQTTGW